MRNKNRKMIMVFFSIVLLFGFMENRWNVFAAEQSSQQKSAQMAIEKGLDDTLGIPILKGDLWQKMSNDSKVGFIWGFGHVVSIEQYLMEECPELKRDSFVPKVAEGIDNTPLNDVVAQVDRYYEMHPDQLEKPVTSVIWDTMIRPNISAGIGGRPLKTKP